MPRHDGRKNNQLRKIKVTKNYLKYPEGSCLIEFGETRVICTATLEEKVPPFMMNSGKGWITAEYGMLPGSCDSRIRRDKSLSSGRTLEIQRLIGRSLRSVVDMNRLGERTIKIDCDVIQADGGTRTASITGGFIALALSLMKIKEMRLIDEVPLKSYIAAVSVGVTDGDKILDLDYTEDSKAETDMNVVMLDKGDFVEVQGTAEGKAFSKADLDELLDLADKGIKELILVQKENLKGLKLK